MNQFPSWSFTSRLAASLFVAVAAIVSGAEAQEKPAAKKEEEKPANPLQALQEAYAKGVVTTAIDVKDLPKEIGDGAAKARPGAVVRKAQKTEINHTLKYVPFEKPRVQSYQAVVASEGKRTRVQISPDGKKLGAQPLGAKEAPGKNPADAKDIEIPEKAARAVKAIKAIHPDAVVLAITTEVYQDPSGTIDILTYEIEFLHEGAKLEMVASPEGVVPHGPRTVAEKDLPDAVAKILQKEEGKIEGVSQFEFRAGLQFGPLDQSRVIYQLEMEKDGAMSKLNLRADGSAVPAPARPGPQNRSYLGLALEPNRTTVSQVASGSPAERAGIKVGDKLLQIGETKINALADVLKVVQATAPGTEVKVQLQRGEEMITLAVKLSAPPE